MKTNYTIFILIPLLLFACRNEFSGKKKFSKNVNNKPIKKEKVFSFKNDLIFKNLKDSTILSRLFDKPLLSENHEALWKPNYYERMSIGISADGYCHTNIDTILYFTSKNLKKNACVILTTYKYHYKKNDSTKLSKGDCHFCGVPLGIALFQENKEKNWTLYAFEKQFASLGSFGTINKDKDKISLVEMGNSWTCLSLKNGINGNMGEYEGFEHFYSIEKELISGFPNRVLSTVFSFRYFSNYIGLNDEIEDEITAKITLKKRETGYYPLQLIIKDNGKIRYEEYKYSTRLNQYEKSKKTN